jgi:hypothetical protein
VQTRWFQDLPKSEQEDFKKLVLGSQKVLDKLRKICYNTLKDGDQVKTNDYDSPSWAYKQAHLNGRREALEEIIQLISFE